MMGWSPFWIVVTIRAVSSLCSEQLRDFELEGPFLVAQFAHFLEKDTNFSSKCFTEVVHISGIR